MDTEEDDREVFSASGTPFFSIPSFSANPYFLVFFSPSPYLVRSGPTTDLVNRRDGIDGVAVMSVDALTAARCFFLSLFQQNGKVQFTKILKEKNLEGRRKNTVRPLSVRGCKRRCIR